MILINEITTTRRFFRVSFWDAYKLNLLCLLIQHKELFGLFGFKCKLSNGPLMIFPLHASKNHCIACMGGKWKEDTQTHYKEILTIFLFYLMIFLIKIS